jgi:hypothetical protein
MSALATLQWRARNRERVRATQSKYMQEYQLFLTPVQRAKFRGRTLICHQPEAPLALRHFEETLITLRSLTQGKEKQFL